MIEVQNSESISCEECRSLLFDYVTDNLSEQDKSEVLLHIKSCPECEKELEEIKEILGAAAEITDVEVPDELKAAVSAEISAVASEMAKKRTSIYKYAVSTFVPIAACAALAIGIFSGGFYDRITESENMLSTGIDTAAEGNIQEEDITQNDNVSKETEEEKITENNIDIPDNSRVNNETSRSGSALPKSETAVNEPETNTDAAEVETDGEPSASGGGGLANVKNETENAVEESQPLMMAREGEETAENAGIAVASEYTAEAAAEDKEDIPVTCVVVTENPAEFVSGFGIVVDNEVADEISFELSADRWREFVDYNRGYGAEFSAEYSGEPCDVISITVKAE